MITLKPFKNSDAEKIASWIGDEHTYYMICADKYGSYPLNGADICAYYKALGPKAHPVTAFEGNDLVGHLLMRPLDGGIRFSFVLVDSTVRSKGYGRQMLTAALKTAFEELKAKEVTIGVFESNIGAYNLYKSLGFCEFSKTAIKVSGKEQPYITLKKSAE